MARKRNLFLYNIQPILKRCKRFILFALLGLMLSLYPWLPSTAREGDPQVLNQQGSELLAMGKAEAALTTWKKAEELYRDAGHQMGVIGSQINQAQALEALGHYRKSCDRILVAIGSDIIKCDKLTKDKDKDKDNLEEVLAKFQVADDYLNFMGLQSLGNMLRKIGKLEESQQILESSWAVEKLLGNSETESQAWLSLGNTARARANKYKDLDNLSEANKYNIQALEDYQNAAEMTKSANTKLQAQLNQLRILLTEENLPEYPIINTSKLLSEIQFQIKQLPVSKMAVDARINLACSLFRCDGPSEASGRKENYLLPIAEIEKLLKTAEKDADSLRDPEGKSHALGYLGMLYAQTGKRDDAKRMTRDALHLAMANNAGHIAYQWQWQMGRLLMQEQSGAKAAIARQQEGDRKRAIEHYRAAFETLKSVRRALLSINDVEFSFRVQVEPVYRELVDLLLLESDRVSNAKEKESLIEEAVEVIDDLRLAKLENFLNCNLLNRAASDGEDTEQVSVEDVEKKKVYEKVAVIYPIILPDRLEIIFKLPGEGWKHRSRAIGKIEVEDTINRLQMHLRTPDFTTEVQEDGQKLYNWLIQPLEKNLENFSNSGKITTLVFGLDDSLRNIPMAVLYNNGEYLIEKYAIAVILSQQIFDARSRQGRLKVLTAGVGEKREVEGKTFPALQYVPAELEKIREATATKLPKSPLLNQEFTEAELEQQIDSAAFSIVHIATHGEFNSDPEETFILAWNELIKVKEFEKILKISDPDRSKAIELLVLSACETAQGNRRAALGLAGIAAQARVRSTVATLWLVDDQSAPDLMSQFYMELKKGKNIAEALQQAQLTLLKDKDNSPPYFWAPYIIVGNWL